LFQLSRHDALTALVHLNMLHGDDLASAERILCKVAAEAPPSMTSSFGAYAT
jgi:hypothetical protein